MPWPLPENDADLIRLAKAYPFDAPARSYLFRGGTAHALVASNAGEKTTANGSVVFDQRVAVIAHGSNRSPEQLRRKYGDDAEIPVTYGWLTDYDVVYSAHVTRYGSVASTLQHTPGCKVQIAINWLTDAQLGRMHETEGHNYAFGHLSGAELDLETGPANSFTDPHLYLSGGGCLGWQGAPVGLTAVKSKGRRYSALDQEAALALICDRHHPESTLDAFILEAIRNPEGRRKLIAEMSQHAITPAMPHFEEIGR